MASAGQRRSTVGAACARATRLALSRAGGSSQGPRVRRPPSTEAPVGEKSEDAVVVSTCMLRAASPTAAINQLQSGALVVGNQCTCCSIKRSLASCTPVSIRKMTSRTPVSIRKLTSRTSAMPSASIWAVWPGGGGAAGGIGASGVGDSGGRFGVGGANGGGVGRGGRGGGGGGGRARRRWRRRGRRRRAR